MAKHADIRENFAVINRLLLSQLAHFVNLHKNGVYVSECDDDKREKVN